MRRVLLLIAGIALAAAACSADSYEFDGLVSTTTSAGPDEVTDGPIGEARIVAPAISATARNQIGYRFPPAPGVDTGPPDPALVDDLDALFTGIEIQLNLDTLARIGDSGDARVAWLLSDILRFAGPGEAEDAVVSAFESLTGATLAEDPVFARSSWQSLTDHLLAWDTPALPDYVRWKAQIYTLVDDRWAPFFADEDAAVDWRLVSWGGVRIDDRPLGTPDPCARGCIPALDDPAVTDAAEGSWYPDDRLIFGVVLNGEARAYPRNIMEIHEMVNDTLGGRRIAIPYCTLCGSAQAYFTDRLPEGIEQPVLRTSGLLSRSNKVMYDLTTFSILDTFTGEAVSGPLQDAELVLEQTSVVTSTWGAWKEAHPDTTIIARDGGIGRTYDLDPLGGRDDNGPIFPIGAVDERLATQAKVLGVIDANQAIAFDVAAARATLDAGGTVSWRDIELVAEGSGVRAQRTDGTAVTGHEAFWFAWSQFHPDTLVWTVES